MKETKVYVDELPESCIDCDFAFDGKCQALESKEYYCIENCRRSDCPLHSIKDHDKELVARVLKEVEDTFTQYLPLRNRTGAWFYGRLNEILKKYQKEFEDGK